MLPSVKIAQLNTNYQVLRRTKELSAPKSMHRAMSLVGYW